MCCNKLSCRVLRPGVVLLLTPNISVVSLITPVIKLNIGSIKLNWRDLCSADSSEI